MIAINSEENKIVGPVCKELNGYPIRIMDVPDGFYAIVYCGDAKPLGPWCPWAKGHPGKPGRFWHGTLKMKAKFWEDIDKGYKKYEYRKISKGLIEDWYLVVDAETGKELGFIYLLPWSIYRKGDDDIFVGHEPSRIFVKNNYVGKHGYIKYKITKVKERGDIEYG